MQFSCYITAAKKYYNEFQISAISCAEARTIVTAWKLCA